MTASMSSRSLVATLSLVLLISVALLILWPFASALAWAAIIGYLTRRMYVWLARHVRSQNLAALLMTLLVLAFLLLPLAAISAALQREVASATEVLAGRSLADNVIGALAALPWLGERLADLVQGVMQSPGEVQRQAGAWVQERIGSLFAIAGGLGRNLLTLLLMFLTLFFTYRDSELWMSRAEQVAQRLYGTAGLGYLKTVRAATRAVVYGLLVTLVSQGVAAGIGFWITGVPAPMLLALATALFALVPFGPIITVGAGVLWLFLMGSTTAALGLALWGLVVVGLIDNLLRPLVMSKGLHVHYLVATLGVLGGVSLFGLIGIFVGPIVLAVLATLARSWLGERSEEPAEVVAKPAARLLQPLPPNDSAKPAHAGAARTVAPADHA